MEMKASVKYNDYRGTSAADMSDYQNLKEYLKSKGVDVEKYTPIGVDIYCRYSDYFNVRFICKEAGAEGKAVTIGFEKKNQQR